MSFEKMMEQLKRDYLAGLPAKIEHIRGLTKSQQWGDVREEFHKLKGTGQTYGVPEISLLGEVAEKLCLEKKDLCAALIPEAVFLLEFIHNERTAARAVVLTDNTHFIKMKSGLGRIA